MCVMLLSGCGKIPLPRLVTEKEYVKPEVPTALLGKCPANPKEREVGTDVDLGELLNETWAALQTCRAGYEGLESYVVETLAGQ
jgi:hypothetical protein